MRAVAARAKVAPATAYTYFSSKNHLIAEVYLDLVRQVPYFTDVNDPMPSRVEQVLRHLALVVADEPEVSAACTTALLSGGAEPAVAAARDRIGAEIHRRITDRFASEDIFFEAFYHAPYSVESNHWMRKPNPGMLEAGARDHGIDLKQSWMIGDRLSDVDAGYAAGCRTILLKGVEEAFETAKNQPHGFFGDLLESARFILQNKN